MLVITFQVILMIFDVIFFGVMVRRDVERDLWNSDGLLVTSEKLTVDFWINGDFKFLEISFVAGVYYFSLFFFGFVFVFVFVLKITIEKCRKFLYNIFWENWTAGNLCKWVTPTFAFFFLIILWRAHRILNPSRWSGFMPPCWLSRGEE